MEIVNWFPYRCIQTLEARRYNNDFSHTSDNGTTRVAYGRASGCYGDETCRHGGFNIDLTGTGFMVHPQVKWLIKKYCIYTNNKGWK